MNSKLLGGLFLETALVISLAVPPPLPSQSLPLSQSLSPPLAPAVSVVLAVSLALTVSFASVAYMWS